MSVMFDAKSTRRMAIASMIVGALSVGLLVGLTWVVVTDSTDSYRTDGTALRCGVRRTRGDRISRLIARHLHVESARADVVASDCPEEFRTRSTSAGPSGCGAFIGAPELCASGETVIRERLDRAEVPGGCVRVVASVRNCDASGTPIGGVRVDFVIQVEGDALRIADARTAHLH